ncbi:beta-N-acetylhexosaminidase [Paenibacillus bouchesdurhonensis]|uniref:hypothetical protein n=1 Tax=Paenibacillus bouchesdurhonensis TaxID=1870990 RepID=UPI000DA615C8|nr:hypothetical protein [Paenibacillus bouchesdurhonensis]
MSKLIMQSNHPVLAFACEEWNRLLQLSGRAATMPTDEVWVGTWEELKNGQPELLGVDEWRDSGFSDEFVIYETENKIVLSGKSERAALYAVYQYAQEAWGIHCVYPGSTSSTSNMKQQYPVDSKPARETIRWYAPRMERRGFVFETINEPHYLKEMIDWFGHNKINEMFFTFSLWDQVGEEIAPELIKRGIQVTLGGHSMKFILNRKEYEDLNAEADHPYTAKSQLNFKDSTWQTQLLQDITAYCHTVPNLTRISLWPEDIADRQTEGFLEYYVQFTEKLKASLCQSGLDVEVEHIAYNAGLAWNMLERNEAKPSTEVDTLYAFWGRDYRYGYDNSPHESDRRAKEALEDWARRLRSTERKLTIFEYYSDHFMLTNLFPFLPQRILKDVAYYEQQNLLGMVNLVVPYRGSDPYPWKWVHGFNSYVFCKALWSDQMEEILTDYYSCYPESERAAVQALFEVIEAKLPRITSWNALLFPARVVDPEKANVSEEQQEMILATLEDIGSSIQSILQQSGLNPDLEPYRYAQHILNYTDNLKQRWLKQ